MKKWVCHKCGYIALSEEEPEKCEGCGSAPSRFTVNWASFHKFGRVPEIAGENVVTAVKHDADTDSYDAARYFAAARVAYREGYPEIGAYLKEAAQQKLEEAAKAYEILGDGLSESTEENLIAFVDKLLLDSAKKSGTSKLLLAIPKLHGEHEIYHENARDDARIGEAFAGLVRRFFGKEILEK